MAGLLTAFVFPGQGSQFIGMGRDLAHIPAARRIFDEADDFLGFPLSQIMFEGSADLLDDTANTQPAIFTMSAAVYCAIGAPLPAFVAGHSLGEYAALFAARVFTFAEGLRLVRERGRLMKMAGDLNPGAMAAIIGLEDNVVNAICAGVGRVQTANFNSPGQVIISGTKDAVATAMSQARQRRARLVRALNVSVASHSALMEPAVADYAQAVMRAAMRQAQVPVIGNTTGLPLMSVESIREELVGQLTRAVQWTRTIEWLLGEGVGTFVEIGPGQVLTGLIRRTAKNSSLVNVGDFASVQQFGSQEQP